MQWLPFGCVHSGSSNNSNCPIPGQQEKNKLHFLKREKKQEKKEKWRWWGAALMCGLCSKPGASCWTRMSYSFLYLCHPFSLIELMGLVLYCYINHPIMSYLSPWTALYFYSSPQDWVTEDKFYPADLHWFNSHYSPQGFGNCGSGVDICMIKLQFPISGKLEMDSYLYKNSSL